MAFILKFGKLLKFALIVMISAIISFSAVNPAYGQKQQFPALALKPDTGWPIWLTNDPVNYLPLITDQSSGLDWIGSYEDENGRMHDWLIICDDSSPGSIRLVEITDDNGLSSLAIRKGELTLPPPGISGLPINPDDGYDWESISLHEWSGSIFLSQEGRREDIGIFAGKITPSDIFIKEKMSGSAGEVGFIPGHIVNMKKLALPGWDEVIRGNLSDNMGIEGMDSSSDRLFIGVESPFSFAQRIVSEKSTVLAIWKINPENPADMENCELLKAYDTSEFTSALGFTIETICGLDAIDRNHVVGIDRDNAVLFALIFSDDGEFESGRIFPLYVPGPEPLKEDDCPELEGLPKLLRPSLESVAVVPVDGENGEIIEYRIYLAVDPWGPGWALLGKDWSCPKYEERLKNLLPALYRYTVPA
ncbi:MAG: hypothetical protein ABIC40_03760, partial [bacterium]